MGEAQLLVILPYKLIGRIVFVACGIGAVADRENVAVFVVGVGIPIILADLPGAITVYRPSSVTANAAPPSPEGEGSRLVRTNYLAHRTVPCAMCYVGKRSSLLTLITIPSFRCNISK